jgi:phenylalanine-4-hydroxylase
MQNISQASTTLLDETLEDETHADTRAAAKLPNFIEQHWTEYTQEQHDVWGILYQRRMNQLISDGSRVFLDGAKVIGLRQDRVPDLADVNAQLSRMTGWEAVPVSGFLPAREFFLCLSMRRFPTTITVRPREQMDYLPEPDIFHDVFGHVPLHADPAFADFLQRYGRIACAARDEADVVRMTRLFWFTVEFGLVQEEERTKVYGSGLISSHGDSANALGPSCERRPFSLDAVFNQPFEIDHLQDVLFVVDSFGQLFEAVNEAEQRICGGVV